MEFKRSINPNGSQLVDGDPGFKQMYRYNYTDDLFAAELFQVWSANSDWNFEITLADYEPRKEIANSMWNKAEYKTLESAKQMVEKLIGLLHRANENKEFWIAKGIMLGFTDVDQMEHLKEYTK